MIVDESTLEQIRIEYVAGRSLRDIAGEYNVSKSAVAKWAKKYGWPKLQSIQRKTASLERRYGMDSMDVDTEADTEDYQMMRKTCNMVLLKVYALLDLEEALAPRDLKAITSLLVDIKSLMDILSPREAAEQAARLLQLQIAGERAESAQAVTVRFVDEAEDLAQ